MADDASGGGPDPDTGIGGALDPGHGGPGFGSGSTTFGGGRDMFGGTDPTLMGSPADALIANALLHGNDPFSMSALLSALSAPVLGAITAFAPALGTPLIIAKGLYGLATNPGQTIGGAAGSFFGNLSGLPGAAQIGGMVGSRVGNAVGTSLGFSGPYSGGAPTPTGALSAPTVGMGGTPIDSSNYDHPGPSLVNPYYG